MEEMRLNKGMENQELSGIEPPPEMLQTLTPEINEAQRESIVEAGKEITERRMSINPKYLPKGVKPKDKYALVRPGNKIVIDKFVFKIKFFDLRSGRCNLKFIGELPDDAGR